MEKTITIGGVKVKLKANAATPRYYRDKFGQDLLRQLNLARQGHAGMDLMENLVYIMAWQADPEIESEITQWLERFDDPMAIEKAMPDILQLWAKNNETTAEAKKK